MAEPLVYEGTGYEVVEEEPPEILGRNLVAASYLLASATAFFFVGFLFAYFYLRSLNNGGMWKPKGVDASVGWGTAVVACFVRERPSRAARAGRPPCDAAQAVADQGAGGTAHRSRRARAPGARLDA